MGNAKNIRIGPCEVYYGDIDDPKNLGYTYGGVNVKYSVDTYTFSPDGVGVGIKSGVTKHVCKIKVPLAEKDFEKFSWLIPDSSINSGLELKGKTIVRDCTESKCLILKDLRTNEFVTFYSVFSNPAFNIKYDKVLRVYEFEFKAVSNTQDYVEFWSLLDADYYTVSDLQFLTTESGDMLIGE